MLKFFIYIGFWIFVCTASFAKETPIFAIDVIRHGDRTPLIISPEMEKIWPQGVGQLTPKGMSQEYELGKFLRQQYVDQYHLLPKHYNTSSMRVRSSGMERTMMSAQSMLLGLYPLGTGPSLGDSTKALPQGFQPIPINTVLLEQDILLVPNHDKAAYRQLLETHVFNRPEWIQKELELKPNYSVWSNITGVPINNLIDVIYFSDRLMIERLYRLPLPDGLQEKDADKMMDAGKWGLLQILNHPKLASIGGQVLAQTIRSEISSAAEQNRPLKYLLFVAHDTTLAAQLKLLGQPIEDIPPYASQLNYALFDMGGSHYEVRVTYNQKPLFIKQCGGNTCSLSEFVKMLDI